MNIINDIINSIDTILLKVFSPVKWKRLVSRLHKLLYQTWNEQQETAIVEAIKRLEDPSGAMTAEDVEIVLATLEEHLGRPMSELLGEEVANVQRTSYETAFKDLELKFQFGKKDARVLRWLEQDALYWIESYYDREVREQLQEELISSVSLGESRLQAGKRLQSAFGARVKKDNLYWEGLSNHVVTRTREFGKVSGYQQAGISYIEVRAVLDNRTTQICRYMHGRIFKTSDAKKLREKIMSADTPDEIKRVAPWITGGKVKRMKTFQLADEGVILPPYHWNCRSTTVMWDEDSIEGNQVEEMHYGGDVTTKQKEALNIYSKEEYSNWVRDYRTAQKNIDYDEGDLEHDMEKHAKRFGISEKGKYISKAKAMIAESKRVYAHEWKDGNIQFLFFGEDGYVVADTQFFIRGAFYHKGLQNALKAATRQHRKKLWLKLIQN